jgi:hypothetical protein
VLAAFLFLSFLFCKLLGVSLPLIFLFGSARFFLALARTPFFFLALSGNEILTFLFAYLSIPPD